VGLASHRGADGARCPLQARRQDKLHFSAGKIPLSYSWSAARRRLNCPIGLGDFGMSTERYVRLIAESGLFDEAWYTKRHRAASTSPILHYVRFGAAAGFNPSPCFDTNWYLSKNPDVAASKINPLVHYIRHGAAEGRSPHPQFDTVKDLNNNLEVAATGLKRVLYDNADAFMSPIRGVDWRERPWEGVINKKPWEYRVTAAMVHIDTPDLLAVVLDILRAQTERPFLHVVDSGSLEKNRIILEQMEYESDDLEVTYLRPRAWKFSSEPVSASMDCAFALCKTEFLYATHTDVFLKRRDHLEFLVSKCNEQTPAVGYQMSPRVWTCDLWKRILSHTSSVYHMPSMRKYGISWSMQAAHEAVSGIAADPLKASWPDTEVNVSLCMHRAGYSERRLGDPEPTAENPSMLMIGTETNVPYEDTWLEHVRSTTLHKLYGGDGHDQKDRVILLAEAMQRAKKRILEWRHGQNDISPPPREIQEPRNLEPERRAQSVQ